MDDNNQLFPHLLRAEKPPTFGVGLSQVIFLSKEKDSMSTEGKKLVVIYNGEPQEPLEISRVHMDIQEQNIILHIDTLDNVSPEVESKKIPAEVSPIPEEDTPSTNGVAIENIQQNFELSGEDLTKYEARSDLRTTRIQEEGSETSKIVHISETATYNIQNVDSVENALQELLDAECSLVNQGYRALFIENPQFVFEADGMNFKLVQSCTLCMSSSKTVN